MGYRPDAGLSPRTVDTRTTRRGQPQIHPCDLHVLPQDLCPCPFALLPEDQSRLLSASSSPPLPSLSQIPFPLPMQFRSRPAPMPEVPDPPVQENGSDDYIGDLHHQIAPAPGRPVVFPDHLPRWPLIPIQSLSVTTPSHGDPLSGSAGLIGPRNSSPKPGRSVMPTPSPAASAKHGPGDQPPVLKHPQRLLRLSHHPSQHPHSPSLQIVL